MITIVIYHILFLVVQMSWWSAYNWSTITFPNCLKLWRGFQFCIFFLLWRVCVATFLTSSFSLSWKLSWRHEIPLSRISVKDSQYWTSDSRNVVTNKFRCDSLVEDMHRTSSRSALEENGIRLLRLPSKDFRNYSDGLTWKTSRSMKLISKRMTLTIRSIKTTLCDWNGNCVQRRVMNTEDDVVAL